MAKEIRGIIPAVITPFTPEEQVDEPAFRKVVNFLIEQGVHGLFPAGTGGEFSALTVDEKKRLMDLTVKEAAGRVFVMPKVHKHYIPSAAISILCLGEDCPICQKNSQLIKDNQGVKYANIKGLIPRQERYMVNVYNRTYVKVSPSGKVVYADLGGEFPKNVDGESLEGIEPKPINQVEVLDRGYELFAELQILHKTVVNASNEHIGINNFDIVLTYPGGKTSPKAQPTAFMDEVNVPPESYYVLSSLGIQLTPSEVEKVLHGVRLEDIFASRKESDTLTEAEPMLESASVDTATNVANIFASPFDEEE